MCRKTDVVPDVSEKVHLELLLQRRVPALHNSEIIRLNAAADKKTFDFRPEHTCIDLHNKTVYLK